MKYNAPVVATASFAMSAILAVLAVTIALLSSDPGKKGIRLTPTDANIGDVLAGCELEIPFEARNMTNSTMQLAETHKQCECTGVLCDPAVLPKSQIASCSIRWNTLGRAGMISTGIQQVWMADNRYDAWLCSFTAHCNVLTDEPFLPKRVTLGSHSSAATVTINPLLLSRAVGLSVEASNPSVQSILDERANHTCILIRRTESDVNIRYTETFVTLTLGGGGARARYRLPVNFD